MARSFASLNGVAVGLSYNRLIEIPLDVQRSTALRKECFISAIPSHQFHVLVQFGPEIDYRTDRRAIMVTIAYDAAEHAEAPVKVQASSWLLRDVTRYRENVFSLDAMVSSSDGRVQRRQRKLPRCSTKPRFPRASKDEKRALLDTTASEGGVSIYVHRVRCENHVMPVERDWIPATKLQEFEARQKLVAEFHFVNTDRSKSSRKTQPTPKKEISRTPDTDPHPDPETDSDYEPDSPVTFNDRRHVPVTRRRTDKSRSAELNWLSEKPPRLPIEASATPKRLAPKKKMTRSLPLKDAIPESSISQKQTSHMPMSKKLDSKKSTSRASAQDYSSAEKAIDRYGPMSMSEQEKAAKAKQAYFQDDDQDDEEPLPPREDFEIKQEIKAEKESPTLVAKAPSKEGATGADEKAKKRARLSQKLEDIEIEEKELKIKKRKILVKRQLMELDEQE